MPLNKTTKYSDLILRWYSEIQVVISTFIFIFSFHCNSFVTLFSSVINCHFCSFPSLLPYFLLFLSPPFSLLLFVLLYLTHFQTFFLILFFSHYFYLFLFTLFSLLKISSLIFKISLKNNTLCTINDNEQSIKSKSHYHHLQFVAVFILLKKKKFTATMVRQKEGGNCLP